MKENKKTKEALKDFIEFLEYSKTSIIILKIKIDFYK